MVYGSIYGAARSYVSEGTFNPDYATPSAALDMVTEGLEIDQKFFDLFIEHDFLEAAAYDDVALESTLIAVDESFLGDVWAKIVEFLKTIRDKIVSIFKAAAVKIGALFTRDNEALVRKYEKQFNNSDLSMIIKGFRKQKKEPVALVKGFTPDESFANIGVDSDWKPSSEAAAESESKATIKDLTNKAKDVTVQKMLRNCINKSSAVSDSGKIDWMTILFNQSKDVKAQEISGYIQESLKNHQKAISGINDVEKQLNDTVKRMEDMAKLQEERHNKVEGNEAIPTARRQVEQKKAEVARTICTNTSTCVGKLADAALAAVKFNIKQCRAAYIKIASNGAPNVKNESVYIDALVDADAYEVDSFFEQYSYDYDELTA